MRCVSLDRLAILSIVSTLSVAASAQLAPPPPLQSGGLAPPAPMQSGGLAPPPRDSGPPPPAPKQPGPTQLTLEASQQQDSGRGLEFVYFNVEGGLMFASLDAMSKSGLLVPGDSKSSSVGPALGLASGVRLLYFTLGPRFRYAPMTDWDLWTLDLDAGWRVPLGRLEPHGRIGAGYARLGHSADKLLGASRGVSVSGFNVRLGGGFDYYPTNVFSFGATLDIELLRLARSSVAGQPTDPPAASGYATSASGLGLVVTACAVAGFHF
jgi:hypothetical protein